jgi:DNA-binding SARP family transcriptional activator
LVRTDSRGDAVTFAVHDLAREVYADHEYREQRIPGWVDIHRGALLAFDDREEYTHLFLELLREGSALEISEWLERRGRRLLQMGNHGLLHDALAACGTGMMLARPHLLLLSAELLRDRGAFGDALHKARVARDLAGYSGDKELSYLSSLLVARLQIDVGLVADAVESLGEAIAIGECFGADTDSMALARAYLSACQVYSGDYAQASANASLALEAALQMKNPDCRAKVVLCAAAADGVRRGLWASVTKTCAQILNGVGLSIGLRLQVVCNHACALLEVGEIERARSLIVDALAKSSDYGFEMERASCHSILSSIHAARGDYDAAIACAETAVAGFETLGDQLSLVQLLNHRVAWQLATQRHEQAMADAGRAMEVSVLCGCEWLSWTSILSASAAMLALGDGNSAVRELVASRLIEQIRSSEQHALLADVIIAESERLAGDIAAATERLATHADYIKTGSANWQLAMNARAFPHLTGLLALALGVEELPARLLHMVLDGDRDRILGAAAEVLSEDELAILAARLGVREPLLIGGQREIPRCRVRMFGGLEVTVGTRSVREKSWKKRKARLLFTILVFQQGKDVPREQLYEYLWPEMDCVRARNNLYVVWSAMKAALIPGCGKNTPLPYAENVGGLCRALMPLIDSDIVEFERLRAQVRDAERTQDPEKAIVGYHALAEIYRGELLPGDVYDDWFTSARDRYRMEFGDAMLSATKTCQSVGDCDAALQFARTGVAADPWREDLYQVTMRLLIESGQRSAAIETFMMCKHHLAEDLGLDPSSETMSLYGDILAMEDPAETDSDTAGPGESPGHPAPKDVEDTD